jgi:hypothetical protein
VETETTIELQSVTCETHLQAAHEVRPGNQRSDVSSPASAEESPGDGEQEPHNQKALRMHSLSLSLSRRNSCKPCAHTIDTLNHLPVCLLVYRARRPSMIAAS